ncbi:MAG: hypothetical protein FWD71_09950 [Oscillospiraceae bacterium]|nr:hypothetical protein [Oscillospiraceae bacterium]
MPKKTFKNELNPALQFISTNSETNEKQELETEESISPATAFIPMKRNPLYIETKSKRVQLLMQPNLYNILKETAAQKGTSLNDLIHTILEHSTKIIK